MRTIILILASFVITSMFAISKIDRLPEQLSEMKQYKEIYLAGGCFWGTEHFVRQIPGVIQTEVGYANGKQNWINPTYEDVSTKQTGFAETVKVVYDPQLVTLKFLLELFYQTIDPTSLNKQGNDTGLQYRSGIYFTEIADEKIIQESLLSLSMKYSLPIVVENKALTSFFKAEEYHQNYLDKHPDGYCHIPKELFDIARKSKNNKRPKEDFADYSLPDKDMLRKLLTTEQYAVTQLGATESPFNNKYWNEMREGIYVDITTGEPLFISTDKFESGCGWPSFSKPINDNNIQELNDRSHGISRTEVRSKNSNAHLGHVFTDGPADKGGLRYCINSASLRFIPKEKMKDLGYSHYISLLSK